MTEALDPSNALAGKFFISCDGNLPNGLTETRLTPTWSMATDDDLNVVEIHCRGQHKGWLIGVVVDLATQSVCKKNLSVDAAEDLESIWDAICERCSGSWLGILANGDEIELRPDASATIGVVYEPETRRIASHAYLLTGEEYSERLKQSERKANDADGDGWFTGGLTAHSDIARLLPNQSLRTSSFAPVRLPFVMPGYTSDVATVLDEIASEIDATVKALNTDKQVTVCLTGGYETRALLASLRDQAKSQSFMTIDYPQSPDASLADRLATIANVDHLIVPRIEATQPQKKIWLTGAGHAMAGANKDYFPSVSAFSGQYLIGGFGGEVGRGFLWPAGLNAEDKISCELILARLKMPRTKQNMDAVRNWHANLPAGLDAFQVLDLAYVELRMGPWAFAQPRMRAAPRSIHPLISYNQFNRMLSIPPEFRARDRIFSEIINRHWPALLDVPINRHGNWRDYWNQIVRSVSNPGRVLRKIRQVLLSKL